MGIQAWPDQVIVRSGEKNIGITYGEISYSEEEKVRCLSLQELSRKAEPGEKIKDIPRKGMIVALAFDNEESIDTFILGLQKLKQRFKEKPSGTAQANEQRTDSPEGVQG